MSIYDTPQDHTELTGESLLDALERFIRRFCVLPSEHAYPTVALWIAHTHFVQQLETTGRLAFLSAEPASGKTRALEICDVTCANPLMALDISMAAFFRIVEDRQPTILLDEVDALFTGKAKSEGTEDMRRVINNGYRIGAVVQRVGGKNRDEVMDFRVFTPVAMAGLGNLPDTLMSRSIVVRMKRRGPGERAEPYRDRIHRPEGEALQQQLNQWAEQAKLRYPTLPEGVEDRDADVWEPLIAVADVAGGRWPELAREACLQFIADKPLSTVSLGIRLLTDLRSIWPADQAVMATNDILTGLSEIEEAPWAELYGEGLKPRKLAQMLSEYGAQSQNVRTHGEIRKGYRREDLWDAWQRYCPHVSPRSATSVTGATSATGSDEYVADVADVTHVAHSGDTEGLQPVWSQMRITPSGESGASGPTGGSGSAAPLEPVPPLAPLTPDGSEAKRLDPAEYGRALFEQHIGGAS